MGNRNGHDFLGLAEAGRARLPTPLAALGCGPGLGNRPNQPPGSGGCVDSHRKLLKTSNRFGMSSHQ